MDTIDLSFNALWPYMGYLFQGSLGQLMVTFVILAVGERFIGYIRSFR